MSGRFEELPLLRRPLGEGAFGVVVLATETHTGNLVALKKVPVTHVYGDGRVPLTEGGAGAGAGAREGQGLPTQLLREIKALQQLGGHPNVVKLIDVYSQDTGGPGIVLAFEYLKTDLGKVLAARTTPLPESHVKCCMQMLLRGVAHCHRHGVMHRDLKPSNLLLGRDGVLRIGDFGLARLDFRHTTDREAQYTNEVSTRYYKAPEILFGSRVYDRQIDLWAVGCILGELLVNDPLFPGENDIDQLHRIISVLGTPSEGEWPELRGLPDFGKIEFLPQTPVPWEELLPNSSLEALSLLASFLVYPPQRRVSAEAALRDPFFFTAALAIPPAQLLVPARMRSV